MDKPNNEGGRDLPAGWGAGFPLATMLNVEFGEACALEEYAFLFGYAALLRPKRVLEVGTSCGLGAISIVLGAKMTGQECRVVTIDKEAKGIQKNLRLFPDLTGSIEPIIGDAAVVLQEMQSAKEQFDLCFIDGGHDYGSVSKDWNYARTLADQWIMHDTASQPGVRKLIRQIRSEGSYQVFELNYPPGNQIDDPTGEWYRTLTAPGFCIIQPIS